MWTKTLLTAALFVPLNAVHAQTLAEDLTAQLSDQIRKLQVIGEDNRPAGPALIMRLFATGTAQVLGADAAPGWAIWRVTDGGAFCTSIAIDAGNGTLVRDGIEECVALDLEGTSVRLTFMQSASGTQAFEGTMRPLQ